MHTPGAGLNKLIRKPVGKPFFDLEASEQKGCPPKNGRPLQNPRPGRFCRGRFVTRLSGRNGHVRAWHERCFGAKNAEQVGFVLARTEPHRVNPVLLEPVLAELI